MLHLNELRRRANQTNPVLEAHRQHAQHQVPGQRSQAHIIHQSRSIAPLHPVTKPVVHTVVRQPVVAVARKPLGLQLLELLVTPKVHVRPKAVVVRKKETTAQPKAVIVKAKTTPKSVVVTTKRAPKHPKAVVIVEGSKKSPVVFSKTAKSAAKPVAKTSGSPVQVKPKSEASTPAKATKTVRYKF